MKAINRPLNSAVPRFRVKSTVKAIATASLFAAAAFFSFPTRAGLDRSLQDQGLVMPAAHTSTETMTGTIYAISATLPATYDAAGYAATTVAFSVIGSMINFTAYGAERDVNKIKPINGAVEKIKGQADYGDGDMVFSWLPADAGQIIVKAAEASSNHYSLKITYPDGEIHYLDIIVAGFKYPAAKEGEAFLVTAKIGLCKAPVVIAAP